MPREIITMQCGDCKERNYSKTKNRKTTPDRIELKKFCPPLPEAYAAQGSEIVALPEASEKLATGNRQLTTF